MANRMPSLAALLGLVAVAGYQNRDKIGEFIKGLQKPNAAGTSAGGAASPDRPEQATDMIGSGYGGAAGGSILGGLGDLIDHFRNAGQEQKAKSWVSTAPTKTSTKTRWSRPWALNSSTVSPSRRAFRAMNS